MDAAGGGAEFRFIPAICCVRVAIGGGGGIFPYEDGANPGCCVDGGAETGGAEKPPGGGILAPMGFEDVAGAGLGTLCCSIEGRDCSSSENGMMRLRVQWCEVRTHH